MKIRFFILFAIILGLTGCSSVYYGTMEKLGVHKRDIMVDRVKAARDTQNEAKQQFLTAMEQFKGVVNFQGGDLEKEYNKLNATLQKSEAKATEVRNRIRAVEDVSDALFSEWRAEIKQYTRMLWNRASNAAISMPEENEPGGSDLLFSPTDFIPFHALDGGALKPGFFKNGSSKKLLSALRF